MDKEQIIRLRDLFRKGFDLHGDEREKFIQEVCNDDREMGILLRNYLADMPEEEKSTVLEPAEEAVAMIGPYRILMHRPKFGGGMGVVYEALHETNGAHVAVKLMRQRLVGNKGALIRFQNEQRFLVALNARGLRCIPQFHGSGEFAGIPYFAMEWIEGLPLTKYCKEKKLSVDQRLAVFIKVTDAVAEVHEHRVVHADLKPENIFVNTKGVPKLLDFGIADDPSVLMSPIRLLYGPAGTVGFAPPEQMAGKEINRSADVHNLGVTLYLLLTGKMPRGSKTVPASETGSLAPGIPGEKKKKEQKKIARLDRIVMKAIATDPTQRYPTAKEFAKALRKCRNRIRNRVISSALAASATLGAWMIPYIWPPPHPPPNPEIRIEKIPPFDEYGGPTTHADIAGVVSGIPKSGYHVVVYVNTNSWHVQPEVGTENIPIVNGQWNTWTHTGKSYAALVVKDGYAAANPLFKLPRLNGEVIALAQQEGKHEIDK
jgi:serine/threonine protein kinase